MSGRAEQLVRFYREHRVQDQIGFYEGRKALFDRAAGQAMAAVAFLLGLAAAAGALAGASVSPVWLWSVLATVLPAAATAVGAYSTLYAFEYQSKLYGDAVRAVRAAARPVEPTESQARTPADDATDLVKRVEAAMRHEQGQWGQLTSQIEIPDDTKA